MDKNKITVFVAGHKFTLITDDSEKQVTDIADRVDTNINSIMTQTSMSKERSAILSALNFCDDELKARRDIAQIKEQIKDYITDSANLRSENEELKAKVKELSEEIERLKNNKASVEVRNEIKPQQENDDMEIGADDDLSFDDIDEPTVAVDSDKTAQTYDKQPDKPQPQKQQADKKRHVHDHTNVYRQKYAQEDNGEKKGYTPKRQYSLFDTIDDE